MKPVEKEQAKEKKKKEKETEEAAAESKDKKKSKKSDDATTAVQSSSAKDAIVKVVPVHTEQSLQKSRLKLFSLEPEMRKELLIQGGEGLRDEDTNTRSEAMPIVDLARVQEIATRLLENEAALYRQG